MNKDPEIVRTIKIDDKTIEAHIHLTDDEIRRMLMPRVEGMLANGLRWQKYTPPVISSNASDYEVKQ